jgi:hypothetical protein
MLLIGSRLSRLFPVIGFATLILITTTAQVLSQTPILLMFADGSAQLDQQSNALALAALAGVISHHGTRPGLRVWLMGAAPLDCSTRPCHGDRLLKRRVEGAVSALVGELPGGSTHPGLANLFYDSEDVHRTPDGRSIVEVRLEEIRPLATACPYVIEVQDPALPPAKEDPRRALWLLLPPGHTVRIGRAARFRITAPPADARIHSLVAVSATGVRELLRGSSDALHLREFDLRPPSDPEELRAAAEPLPTGRSERTMGDVVVPWQPEEVHNESEETLAAQCRFPIIPNER